MRDPIMTADSGDMEYPNYHVARAIIVIIFIIFLSNTITVAYSESKYKISGFVTTKDNIPTINIKVELLKGDKVLESDNTDSQGFYRIPTKLDENAEYLLRVSGKGIQNQNTYFEATNSEISINLIVNQNPTAGIDIPKSGYVNEIISFKSNSYDPDSDPLEYRWDFGDGTTSQEENPTHMYTNLGEYIIGLKILDSDGASDEIQKKLELFNRAPKAVHNGPYIIRIGSTIQFTSDGSIDPDNDLLEYHWSFGDKTKSDEPDPKHIYLALGEYKVKLQVIDVYGAKDEVETTCQVVENMRPTVEANGPYYGFVGVPIMFKSEGSNDPDGEIQKYIWEFGDEQRSEDSTPFITFNQIGEFSVSLTLIDDYGDFSTVVTSVEVQNPPPIAVCNGPYSGSVNTLVSFSSSGSLDPEGDPLEYYWSFGDGEISTEAYPRHRYISPGTYTVTLTVNDLDLDESIDTTTCTITTANSPSTYKPPTASTLEPPNENPVAVGQIPYTGELGQRIYFNSSDSYDPDGSIIKYLWSFGDGYSSNMENPTHIYNLTGKNEVILTVYDENGKTGIYTSEILIIEPNIPPIIHMNEYIGVKTDEPINFTAREVYDPDGEITEYSWDFGDNSTSNLVELWHSYSSPGVYNITLTVTDNSNAICSRESTITVIENMLPTPIITGPNSTKTGQIVEFSAEQSFDTDGEIVEYIWDFGDGIISNLVQNSHIFIEKGEYNISLRVTDDNLDTSETVNKIQILKNIPPTIVVNNTFVGMPLEDILFRSKSFDNDGHIVSTLWDFGDEKIAEGIEVNHIYNISGVYYGKIVVTDNNFDTSIEIIKIRINDPNIDSNIPYLTITASLVLLGYILINRVHFPKL